MWSKLLRVMFPKLPYEDYSDRWYMENITPFYKISARLQNTCFEIRMKQIEKRTKENR